MALVFVSESVRIIMPCLLNCCFSFDYNNTGVLVVECLKAREEGKMSFMLLSFCFSILVSYIFATLFSSALVEEGELRDCCLLYAVTIRSLSRRLDVLVWLNKSHGWIQSTC